ncbi:TIGR03621 family F420-dependent LLM class oxidoreductase [Dactylosporangium sp. NPDC048998]|uniref:TIGR03621 family F420-dependent LLM class oxidoreductase n=1 Tax=Dactylosporangium sp. NPDC048998 TaxID=3363976 RepID=UPI00371577A2
MPVLRRPLDAWRGRVRQIEDLGFHTVTVADHLGDGWSMDPMLTMASAAAATTDLRVATGVLCNDFYHPVHLHRSISNLDLLSDGRVTLGLGAGYRLIDYEVSGMPFDPAPVRIARLTESIAVLKGLFGGERVEFTGEHFQVRDLVGAPQPVQQPHPPILVGGGGRRMLELAARSADIVNINPRLSRDLSIDRIRHELSLDGLSAKVDIIRDAAVAAGRDPGDLRLQVNMLDVRLQGGGAEHHWTSGLLGWLPDGAYDKSPLVLNGDVGRCAEALLELRETTGITEIHLGANAAAVAPIVNKLR